MAAIAYQLTSFAINEPALSGSSSLLSSKENLLKARNTIHSITLVLVLAVVLLAAGGASAQDSSGTTHQGLTTSQRTVLLSKTETKIKRYTQSLRHWEIVLGRSHRHLGYQPGSSTSLAYVKWVLSQRMAASRKLHNAAKHVMVKRTRVLVLQAVRLRLELGLSSTVRHLADAMGIEARFNQARRVVRGLSHQWRSSGLLEALTCIHHYEGAWNANTGNGYYGGLQADRKFQEQYGPEFVARWGTADNWPTWAQITAAVRAIKGWNGPDPQTQKARGFHPWPNTAHNCGLI